MQESPIFLLSSFIFHLEMDRTQLERRLQFLPLELRQQILELAELKAIPKDTILLQEGAYVKVIPIVLKGLIKVVSRYQDRELLLYYIQPDESCIMSFSAARENTPSRIMAVTEEETEALLLPAERVRQWVRSYPAFNDLFYQQFYQRYDDLLSTIHLLLFEKLDRRLYDYLDEKSRLKGGKVLELKHWQIANDLGTAREVVSRILKKMEEEGVIRQSAQGRIEILREW